MSPVYSGKSKPGAMVCWRLKTTCYSGEGVAEGSSAEPVRWETASWYCYKALNVKITVFVIPRIPNCYILNLCVCVCVCVCVCGERVHIDHENNVICRMKGAPHSSTFISLIGERTAAHQVSLCCCLLSSLTKTFSDQVAGHKVLCGHGGGKMHLVG